MMRSEAVRLFLLEFFLLLLFLPPFLLLPWGRSGLPAGPVVAVLGFLAVGTSLVAWMQARRAEDRTAWRQAAMLYAVGPGLWIWAAGVAWRLGGAELIGLSLLKAGVLALGVFRFPPPPEEKAPPSAP